MDKSDLEQLNDDIIVNIYELHDLTKAIKELDEQYLNSKNEDDFIFLIETIERYKTIVDKTRILLEALFAEEEKLNIPTNFKLRRLYQKILSAY